MHLLSMIGSMVRHITVINRLCDCNLMDNRSIMANHKTTDPAIQRINCAKTGDQHCEYNNDEMIPNSYHC